MANNVNEMLSELGLRLEDAAKRKFTNATKLILLNDAILRVANLIHPAYLTELEYTQETVAVTSGEVAMTAALLGYKVLKGAEGIINIKIAGTGGLDFTIIKRQDTKKLENALLAASLQNPIAWIWGSTIQVRPTTITSIDVDFRRMPNPLLYEFNSDQADSGASATKFDGRSADSLSTTNDYYNGAAIYHLESEQYHIITDYVGADLEFTVTPANASGNFSENQTFYFLTHSFDELNMDGVSCDLNEALHGLVIDIAEASAFKMDEQIQRSQEAMNMAIAQVQALNAIYQERVGIGTK